MYPLKTWLTKKIILLNSIVKWIKNEWMIFRYFIKKFIKSQKDNLSVFINNNSVLNKATRLIKLISVKIISKILNILNKIPFLNTVLNILNKIPFINKILSAYHKKYLGFLSLAVLISLFIFYFMSVLISTNKNQNQAESQNVNINFLLNAKVNDLELRSRRLPKKPKKEEPPPETPKLKIQQTELQKPEMISQLPQLDLPDDFQSDAKGAGVSAQASQDRDVTPVFRIQPVYPRRAALRNIEGFVILQFDITEIGTTDNITVIQASPPQIFNSSAIQALKKWKYKPKIENGKAVRQNNLKVQLDFNLRDQ